MTQTQNATFSTGLGEQKITPQPGCNLAGYFHERIAKRVRDDLYVKAMVLDNGQNRLAIVCCDLVGPRKEIFDAAKEAVSRECGIPSQAVMICCSHTHTGPDIGGFLKMDEQHNEQYSKQLTAWIARAVRQADENRFDATIHLGHSNAEGLAFNRLLRLRDGKEYHGATKLDESIGPAGLVDPSVQTMTLRDADGNVRGMLVNFACHCDVIGGGRADFISADWPGELARSVRAVYGDDVVCMFMQGAAGDINHIDYLRRRAGYPSPGGEAGAVRLGRAVAGAAILASERAEAQSSDALDFRYEELPIPYYTRTPELFAKMEELKRRDPEELTYFEKANIKAVEDWKYDGKIAQAPMQCFRIAGAAIASYPGELFTAWGLELKKYSPASRTFVAELANRRVSSYIPTTDQARRGGYGAIPILSLFLCPEAGFLMNEAATKQLHSMWSR